MLQNIFPQAAKCTKRTLCVLCTFVGYPSASINITPAKELTSVEESHVKSLQLLSFRAGFLNG